MTLLESYIDRVNQIIWQYDKHIKLAYSVSTNKCLELCRTNDNGTATGVISTLGHGTKNELIDMIIFFLELSNRIDELRR